MKITEGYNLHSKLDNRDRIAKLKAPTFMPKSVDMKPDVFEVEHQGDFSSCAANVGCSALEMIYKRNKMPIDLSRMFLYYQARKMGDIRGDNGSYPRDIVKSLNKIGTCLETTWDYVAKHIDLAPSQKAIDEAAKYKILSYELLPYGDQLNQIKIAVATGNPVLFAMTLHKSFSQLTGDWKTHSWDTKTSNRNPEEGAHAVLVIGYDDNAKRLLVENSWGTDWGDGGFFGFPYDLVGTEAVGEAWIVQPNLAVPIPPPKSAGILALFNFLLRLFKKK